MWIGGKEHQFYMSQIGALHPLVVYIYIYIYCTHYFWNYKSFNLVNVGLQSNEN